MLKDGRHPFGSLSLYPERVHFLNGIITDALMLHCKKHSALCADGVQFLSAGTPGVFFAPGSVGGGGWPSFSFSALKSHKYGGPALAFCLHRQNRGCPSFRAFRMVRTKNSDGGGAGLAFPSGQICEAAPSLPRRFSRGQGGDFDFS